MGTYFMMPMRKARRQSLPKERSITSSSSYSDWESAQVARGAQMSTDRCAFLTLAFFSRFSALRTGCPSSHSGTLAMS